MNTQRMEGREKGSEKNVQWKQKSITSIAWVQHEAKQMGRGRKGDPYVHLPLVQGLKMYLDSVTQ